jgi:ornithine decarboxylase
MECLETGRELCFPLGDSVRGARRLAPCTLTGPSCDSEDTMFLDARLAADLAVGDRVHVYSAGAYTTAYASRFNGFDVPRTYLAGRAAHEWQVATEATQVAAREAHL